MPLMTVFMHACVLRAEPWHASHIRDISSPSLNLQPWWLKISVQLCVIPLYWIPLLHHPSCRVLRKHPFSSVFSSSPKDTVPTVSSTYIRRRRSAPHVSTADGNLPWRLSLCRKRKQSPHFYKRRWDGCPQNTWQALLFHAYRHTTPLYSVFWQRKWHSDTFTPSDRGADQECLWRQIMLQKPHIMKWIQKRPQTH